MASKPSVADLRRAIAALPQGKDLASISQKDLREGVEDRLGFCQGGLDVRREEVRKLTKTRFANTFTLVTGKG